MTKTSKHPKVLGVWHKIGTMNSAKSFVTKAILLLQKNQTHRWSWQRSNCSSSQAPEPAFRKSNCGILLGISHWNGYPIRTASLPAPYNLLLHCPCNLICIYLCCHKHIHSFQLSRSSSGAPALWCLLWSDCRLHICFSPISCLVQMYHLLHLCSVLACDNIL